MHMSNFLKYCHKFIRNILVDLPHVDLIIEISSIHHLLDSPTLMFYCIIIKKSK